MSETQSKQTVIMIVDDEATVRRVAAKILERDGHVVFVAASGEEALTILRDFARTVISY